MDGVSMTLAGLGAIALPVVVLQVGGVNSVPGVAGILTWLYLMLLITLRSWLSLRLRTYWLLSMLYLAMGACLVTAGPIAAVPLAGATAIVVAQLLLGEKAGVAGLALAVLIYVSGFALASQGYTLPVAEVVLLDSPLAWVRDTLIFAVFGMVLLVSVRFAMARMRDSVTDATDALVRLKTEQALREADQVALRERERQLAELQRMESLGRLAGGIAHDFNNSLTVLMAGTHQFEQLKMRDEDRLALADMRAAIRSSSQLIRQLLMLGRQDDINPQLVALRPIMEGLIRSLDRVTPEDVVLSLEVEDSPVVLIDSAKLERVLLNLAINARDAMPSGGTLTILVQVETRSQEERWLHIELADSGAGMTRDVMERAFEPLFTTKTPDRGTGLGLSTAYAIVTGMGGTISLTSQPDQGTRVLLSIPVDAQQDEISEPDHVKRHRVADDATVLVVEDRSGVRRALARSLGLNGYKVLQADRADSAMTIITHQKRIDVLVTDAVMPGLPVKDLIEVFRSKFPVSPVVVCSGHAQQEVVRREVVLERVKFLAKPISVPGLIRTVDDLLHEGREPVA